MREIIFRAKQIGSNEWFEGNFIKHPYMIPKSGDIKIEYFIEANDWSQSLYFPHLRVRPQVETVGQFTGVYDSTKWGELSKKEQKRWEFSCYKNEKGHITNNTKNTWKGKRIFEGDIVKFTNTQNGIYEIGQIMIGRIEYDKDGCYWCCKNNFQCYKDWAFNKDIKVIGNVFDDPELLD